MTAKKVIAYKGRQLMPEPRCVRCSLGIALDTNTYWNFSGPLRCPHCQFLQVIVFQQGTLLGQKAVIDDKYFIVEPNTIPEQPLGDYNEAINCLGVQAWKACAVMSRRAIQGALLVAGVPDAIPRKMIDDARNKLQLFDEQQHHLATTVTFFGGRGGHPQDEEINQVGEIEASTGLWVTKTLLLALFPPPPPTPANRQARRPIIR